MGHTAGIDNPLPMSTIVDTAGIVPSRDNVNHGSHLLPANERQARPLTTLEPDEQREVWQEAADQVSHLGQLTPSPGPTARRGEAFNSENLPTCNKCYTCSTVAFATVRRCLGVKFLTARRRPGSAKSCGTGRPFVNFLTNGGGRGACE